MMRQTNVFGFVGDEDSSKYKSLQEKIAIIEQAEKDGKDTRDLEMMLFKPQDIYVDESFNKNKPDAVKVYFKDKRYYALFCKFFKVAEYIEHNVSRIDDLIFYLLLLDKGIIEKTVTENSVEFIFKLDKTKFDLSEI